LEGLLKEFHAGFGVFRHVGSEVWQGLKIEIVSLQAFLVFPSGAFNLGAPNAGLDNGSLTCRPQRRRRSHSEYPAHR
jgi:hypothetical protein